MPAKIALKDLKKVAAPKGKIKNATIKIPADDLKYRDVKKHAFVLEKGEIILLVGSASDNLKIEGKILAK